MKHIALAVLLLAITFGFVHAPYAFAKSNHNDDDSSYEDRDDDSDKDEGNDEDDRDDDDSNDDDNSTSTLEIEADVFTDTTIIKVEEVNGKKTTFSTDADTEAEVIDAIVAKFNFERAAVEAVLDFEIENRASRADDRKGLNGEYHSSTTPTTNNSNLSELQAKISELQKILSILIELLKAKTN